MRRRRKLTDPPNRAGQWISLLLWLDLAVLLATSRGASHLLRKRGLLHGFMLAGNIFDERGERPEAVVLCDLRFASN